MVAVVTMPGIDFFSAFGPMREATRSKSGATGATRCYSVDITGGIPVAPAFPAGATGATKVDCEHNCCTCSTDVSGRCYRNTSTISTLYHHVAPVAPENERLASDAESAVVAVPDYHLVLAAQASYRWDEAGNWRPMTETERQPAQTAMRDAWIECGVNPPVGVDFGTWLPKALMGIKAREFFCNLPKHDNYPDTQ